MSEVVRLTLVSHAMTDAMAAGRFPTDEPLNAVGRRQVDRRHRPRVSPTAPSAGRRSAPGRPPNCSACSRRRTEAGRSGLRSLARRRTRRGATRRSGDLADRSRRARRTAARSVVELIDTGAGLDGLADVATEPGWSRSRIPAVIRAAILVALDAPPKSFWRIDVAPVSRTVMHFRGHAWTLRSSP